MELPTLNSMEGIIQNPGLQHIIENSLMCLDRKSIVAFQSVNQDCNSITDCPSFYLKKLSHEETPTDLIENWEFLIKKIPDEDVKQSIKMELRKMYFQKCAKRPLELVQEMAIALSVAQYEGRQIEVDTKMLMFIIENSNPNWYVMGKDFYAGYGKFTLMHLAAFLGLSQSARKLIDSNSASPNAPNELGVTPLHAAAQNNQLEFVSLLMPDSNDVNFQANLRINLPVTPIILAVICGHHKMVQLLMTSTTNPNLQIRHGLTAIHFTADYG